MTLIAAPGIYLCIPLEEKSVVNLGKTADKKLLKGKIISVGANRDHDNGGKMEATFTAGDVIYFISYAENYDWFEEKNAEGKTQKYYCVLFHDARAKIEL